MTHFDTDKARAMANAKVLVMPNREHELREVLLDACDEIDRLKEIILHLDPDAIEQIGE